MDYTEIQRIREQHLSNQWPQFLESIEISGLHGFNGEAIAFNYPVCAIVGENGSGKTTILKAAACCYDTTANSKTYYPSKLFTETHWDRIQSVRIGFRIRRGSNSDTFAITKPSERWNYPERKFIRPVYIFEVSRTLPMDAMAGYAKVAKQTASELSSEILDPRYLDHLKHILSKGYDESKFIVPDADEKKKIGLLTMGGLCISQFHQGAGEDATQDLMMALQNVPENSLVLIDEVEASLHPRAQRRLIKFILWISRIKRIQFILTTHSSAVFEELPKEARILITSGHSGKNIVYGATSDFALSRIDDEVTPAFTLFVEDFEAKIFLREIIRAHEKAEEIMPLISIVPVGPADVVQMLGKLGHNKKLPYKSMAFVDGDYSESLGCKCLPGDDAPEKVVFNGFQERRWINLDQRFGVGAGTLNDFLNDAITDPDHHNWTKNAGDKIRIGSSEVWEIMANEWVKIHLPEGKKNEIVEAIQLMIEAG